MPWKSTKQARWGHSSAGIKALGSSGVDEFDAATPKGSLSKKKDNWIKRASRPKSFLSNKPKKQV